MKMVYNEVTLKHVTRPSTGGDSKQQTEEQIGWMQYVVPGLRKEAEEQDEDPQAQVE